MLDFFLYLDRLLFGLLNSGMANPVFDLIMPVLTDLNKYPVALVVALLLWLTLIIKGGRKGRFVAVGLVVVIALSDQLNSSVLKALFQRARPCHFSDGVLNVETVRLIVRCGTGLSFPSSHAVNNAAVAAFLTASYPAYKWYFIIFAGFVAYSRIYVGVHFPFDVLAGIVVGILCGLIVLVVIRLSDNLYSRIFRVRNKGVADAQEP